MKRVQGWTTRAVILLVALLPAVLGGASGTCLAAEGPFSDAPPAEHWAAPAVTELGQQKLLIGYPDGTFRGDQAATRYELAMALSRLYRLICGVMEKETVDPQALARLADEVQKVQEALAQVEGQVGTMDGRLGTLGTRLEEVDARVADTNRRVDETKQQVAEVDRRVDGLKERLTVLEQAKPLSQAEAEVEGKLQVLAERLQKQVDEAEQRLLDRQTKQDAALERLRKALAQTVDQLALTVRELTEMRQTGEGLAAEVTELRQKLEALSSQLAELAKNGESLTRRVEALEGLTGDLGQGVDGLQQRVDTLEGENQKLREGLRRMGWLVALGAAVLAVF